jgi:hypothetical protein
MVGDSPGVPFRKVHFKQAKNLFDNNPMNEGKPPALGLHASFVNIFHPKKILLMTPITNGHIGSYCALLVMPNALCTGANNAGLLFARWIAI